MIGAWCFVDHYGPEDIAGKPGMRVPPHPHSGLQTVSWLLEGEVQHRDSLGSNAIVRPGQLNLMTSGPGIAHSEESPPDHSAVDARDPALGRAARRQPATMRRASFSQHRELPVVERDGLRATVVMGEFEGSRIRRADVLADRRRRAGRRRRGDARARPVVRVRRARDRRRCGRRGPASRCQRHRVRRGCSHQGDDA